MHDNCVHAVLIGGRLNIVQSTQAQQSAQLLHQQQALGSCPRTGQVEGGVGAKVSKLPAPRLATGAYAQRVLLVEYQAKLNSDAGYQYFKKIDPVSSRCGQSQPLDGHRKPLNFSRPTRRFARLTCAIRSAATSDNDNILPKW